MPEMSRADVPVEFVKAATDAWVLNTTHGGWDGAVRAMLAAVLPLYEQQLRERIAGELYGLPVVQHLGIARSNATQPMANAVEAALRWVINVVLRPDLVPEKAGDEANPDARARMDRAWPTGLPKPRGYDYPTGGGDA